MRGLGAGRVAQRQNARPTHRRSPRRLSAAIDGLAATLEPGTALARVQRVWPQLVHALPASADASPTALREGVLSVRCNASVYAHELHLIGDDLIVALNGALGEELVRALRVRTG